MNLYGPKQLAESMRTVCDFSGSIDHLRHL
jgi:hypothetical protein